MLIALYLFFANVVVPQLGKIAQALLEPVMVIVIILAGIVMLFGAVGFKISNGLGSTVVGGIFQAIGYVFRKIFQAIGWVVRSVFKMIPRIFKESRTTLSQLGLKDWLSNVLAGLSVIALVAIII